MMGGSTVVSSASFRRDNVAKLAKKNQIWITNLGKGTTTDENWDILAEVIRTTTSLEKLKFQRGTAIALQNDKVVDALANNCTITLLCLWGWTSGSNKGAKAVAAILKENSMIESVNLGDNSIGNEEAKTIADALKHNKTLQRIDLGHNHIGNEGAKAIAEALKENVSLQTLDIGRNKIGDKGGKAIAEALKGNHSLQKLYIEGNNIGEEGGKQILNALQHIDSSAIDVISLRGNQISEETQKKIKQEVIRINKRFKSVGSNQGQVASVATAAGKPQGVWNKKSKRLTTIHTTNATCQVCAENVHETNRTGHNTTTMETKTREQQSIIARLLGKIVERDNELALIKDIMKTIGEMGNLVNGGHAGNTINTRNASMPDRETELQSEIERYKQEVDSLKEKLKNSRPIIETVDLTNEIGGDDSNEEEPPSKRRRTKSSLAVALEQTQQIVQVKEEAKERAAAAEANVAVARREKDAVEASLRDVQEDFELSEELVIQQTLATNILQGRIDELCGLARAAGVDGSLLSEIRYRPLSSER